MTWIPSERILFAGCMCKDMGANNLGNTADADLMAWQATIEKVMDKFPGARIVIPGHGPIGGTELLRHTDLLLQRANKAK